jgi:hypothetical protein
MEIGPLVAGFDEDSTLVADQNAPDPFFAKSREVAFPMREAP